jgi:hypothetical protein
LLEVIVARPRNQLNVRELSDRIRLLHFGFFVLLQENTKLAVVVAFRHLKWHNILKTALEGEQVLQQNLLVSNELVNLLQVRLDLSILNRLIHVQASAINWNALARLILALNFVEFLGQSLIRLKQESIELERLRQVLKLRALSQE